MAAVLGKGAANIEPTTPNVYVANRNAPQQLVISGESSAVLQESNRLSAKVLKSFNLRWGMLPYTIHERCGDNIFD